MHSMKQRFTLILEPHVLFAHTAWEPTHYRVHTAATSGKHSTVGAYVLAPDCNIN
jgi:hypothetical protein